MADLEKLAFGGEEIQYDKLPELGSRFALGSRDIQQFTPVASHLANTKHVSPALEDVAAASVQGSDPIETEVFIQTYLRSLCQSHSHDQGLATLNRLRQQQSQSLRQKNLSCLVSAQHPPQAQ